MIKYRFHFYSLSQCIIIFFLLIVVFSNSFAETDSTYNKIPVSEEYQWNLYKISIGLGSGSLISYLYDYGGKYISLRNISHKGLLGALRGEFINVDILYGKSSRKNMWYTSIGTGVSCVNAIDKNNKIHFTIGLPLQVEISKSSFYPYFGYALIGYANINSIENYCGIMLCFQFGIMQ